MSKRAPMALIVVAALGAGLAVPQEQASLDFPQLPVQQKLARVVSQMVGQTCLDIAFVKSLGKTPEDYLKFRLKATLPSWDVIRGKGPGIFVTMFYINNSIFADYRMEVLEQSPTQIKVRSNRPYMGMFDKDLKLFGTTLEEYERFRALSSADIAAYLGYDYRETLEAGWLVMTVTQKK